MSRVKSPILEHAPRCPKCRALVPPSYSRCTDCGTHMLVLTPTRASTLPTSLAIVVAVLVVAAILVLAALEVWGR